MLELRPNRQPRDLTDTVQWLNSSGETIPAYGVVKLFSYDDVTNQFQADKPDGTDSVYFASGGVSIPADKFGGSLIWNAPRRCLVDSSDYSIGDLVGPVEGQWAMGAAGTGFRILRPPNVGDVAVVMKEGGGGNANILHGRVHESLGKGYYIVELRTWSGSTPDCEGDPNCTPCRQVTGSLSTSVDDICGEIILPDPVLQTSETSPPVFVLAYHRASYYVPLMVDTDCILVDIGDSNPISDALSGLSSSGGGYGDEPVYQILDGVQTHTVQYKDTYECCGTGEDVLTKRTAIIFAALVCDEVICNPCNGA